MLFGADFGAQTRVLEKNQLLFSALTETNAGRRQVGPASRAGQRALHASAQPCTRRVGVTALPKHAMPAVPLGSRDLLDLSCRRNIDSLLRSMFDILVESFLPPIASPEKIPQCALL